MQKISVSKNIKISPSYLRKTVAREFLQNLILNKINEGEITDDAGVQEFLDDLHRSLDYLKTLKFDTLMKIRGK